MSAAVVIVMSRWYCSGCGKRIVVSRMKHAMDHYYINWSADYIRDGFASCRGMWLADEETI